MVKFDINFVLQLFVVVGGWISIYINTQNRITKLEEKNTYMQSKLNVYEESLKELKTIIKENTEAIVALRIELSKLNKN